MNIDLQDLRDKLLAPRAIERDNTGMLDHPDLPAVDEYVNMRMFFSAFGIECGVIMMDDDVEPEVFEAYEGDCSSWTPSRPTGEDWVLVSIHDTEDGPAALYVRRATPAPRERPLHYSSKDGRLLRANEPDDGALDADEVEGVIACLGDDAARLRDDDYSPEVADNMDRAADLLQSIRAQQGAEAVRLLTIARSFIAEKCGNPLVMESVLNVIDLATEEAQGMAGGPFVQMVKEDAASLDRILSILGMEEEGDPVPEVEDAITQRARYAYLRTRTDKTTLTEEALDAECDAQIDEAVNSFARAMHPRAAS